MYTAAAAERSYHSQQRIRLWPRRFLDVTFYGIHCAGNIIAPDPEADQWQRHIIEAVNSAEEMAAS